MSWQADQQWLWQKILLGDIHDPEAASRIHAGQLPVTQRLGIYAGGYRQRLLECMRASFPLLQAALGESLFDRFALDYLDAQPSQSYTLHDLGQGFANHLQATRPDSASETADWVDFMIALTRFERVLSEVYDGPGDERAEVSSLRLACSLRLLRLSHPVHEALRAHQAAEAVRPSMAKTTHLALVRRAFRVSVEPITGTEFRLLERVATIGLPAVLGEVRAGVGDEGMQRWIHKMRDRGVLLGQALAG